MLQQDRRNGSLQLRVREVGLAGAISLDMEELRAVAAYAAECAADVLSIFERPHPSDARPREAVDAAWTFARGGRRTKSLRDAAWAALRAAKETKHPPASHAARAAMCAASAAFLHPLAHPTQINHIIGAAAHAARSIELAAAEAPPGVDDYLELTCRRAPSDVVEVLLRYPSAPPGRGRVGELLRALDRMLRGSS